MNNLYLEKLNKRQLEAVKHFKGPCMVYAGPGSGKTMVIIHRVGYLIEHYNIEPDNILVISFTRAAADEMKLRFEASYGWLLDRRKNVSFGTFHSTFFRILRSYNGYGLNNVLDEKNKYSIIRNIIKSFGFEYCLDNDFIKDVILDISLYKNNMLDKKDFVPDSMSKDDFDEMISLYEDYKDKYDKIDFDDMLTKCYELLTNKPMVLKNLRNIFQYILIDEFQDINNIQFEIIKLLSGPDENLFVVGDDDQSIYSFRGADPKFILKFDKIYNDAKKIVLDLNYRSQENIIRAANKLIDNNDLRVEKTMMPIKEPGIEVQFFSPESRESENNHMYELIGDLLRKGYQYKDIAVIYRTNMLSGPIADFFLDNNIPFASREKIYNIYEHWVSKDIICYLRSALNINDTEALKRILNRPTRYITNKAKRAADKYHKDYITSLKVKGGLMPYQIEYLDRLEIDLKNISHLSTADAVNYIRKDIGYDNYICNHYCSEKQINPDGLMEVLDELEEMSSKHDNISQFINYIKEFKASLYRNIRGRRYSSKENQVELLTMHRAKGLEFKIVIIIEAVEDIIPHSKNQDKGDVEEERRLFYVAVTRAKERLYIYSPLYRHNKQAKPSRFIDEMEILKQKQGGKQFMKYLTKNLLKR